MTDSTGSVAVDGGDGGSSSVGSPVVFWPSGALAVAGLPQSVFPGVESFPAGMALPIDAEPGDGSADVGDSEPSDDHGASTDGHPRDDDYDVVDGNGGHPADGGGVTVDDGYADGDFPDDDDDVLMSGRVGINEDELEEEQEELRLRGRAPRGLALKVDLGLTGDEGMAELVPGDVDDDDDGESEHTPIPARIRVFHRPFRYLGNAKHPSPHDEAVQTASAAEVDAGKRTDAPEHATGVPRARVDDGQVDGRRLHAVAVSSDGSFIDVPDGLDLAADAVHGLVGTAASSGRVIDVFVYDGTESVFAVIGGNVSTYVEATVDGLVAAYRPGSGAWTVDGPDAVSMLFAG